MFFPVEIGFFNIDFYADKNCYILRQFKTLKEKEKKHFSNKINIFDHYLIFLEYLF